MAIWLQIILAIAANLLLVFASQSESTQKFAFAGNIIQLLSALWAGWDSSKIGLNRYKTAMSLHPASVFILCFLLWIVFFPMYLFARDKVLTGKAPLKLEAIASQGKNGGYILRLLGFASVCLLLGGLVLFCLFAPRINPGFINGYLFQKEMGEQEKTIVRSLASPEERKFLESVFADLEHPLTNDDFKRLSISKPEYAKFQTKDGIKLHGWFFQRPLSAQSKALPATVLFSTNGLCGMKLPVLLGYIKLLQDAGFSTFIYDYRGYDSGEGQSTTQTVVTDGRAAYDYLVNERKVDPKHLILMGNQLGAYVSCQLSTACACAGMVLEDPWINLKEDVDSTMAVAMRVIPLSLYPGDGLDNLKVLKEKHPPVLIAASSYRRDGTYEIYSAIDNPKTFVRLQQFDSLGLTDLAACRESYLAKLKTFLKPKTAPASDSAHIQKLASKPAVIKWRHDFDQALIDAKMQHKYLLVDFYTSWCGVCKVMDQKTYSDAAVEQLMAQRFISVKIDAEAAQSDIALAKKYRVTGFPTAVILEPDGKVISKMTGYVSAKPLSSILASVDQ